jgi:hypothetical protein
MRNTFRVIAAMVLISATAQPCFADEADNKVVAKQLFQKGVDFYREGMHELAVENFRKANEMFPSWKLQYNIAQCDTILKNYGQALDGFEAYLAGGGDNVTELRQQEVRTEMDRLRDLSGELLIKAPDGTVVVIDGNERVTLPVVGSLRLAIGEHSVVLIHNGEAIYDEKIRMRGRKVVSIDVPAEPHPKTPTVIVAPVPFEQSEEVQPQPMDSNPEDDSSPSSRAIWGWTLAGVGGATLVAAAITGGVSISKTHELEDRCPDKQCPESSDRDLKDSVDSLSAAADVMYVVGGVLAATGIVLLITEIGDESKNAEGKAEIGFAPIFGPGNSGLVIEGRF